MGAMTQIAGIGTGVGILLTATESPAQRLDPSGAVATNQLSSPLFEFLPADVRMQRRTSEYAAFVQDVRGRLATNAPVHVEALNAAYFAREWLQCCAQDSSLSKLSASDARARYFDPLLGRVRAALGETPLDGQDPVAAFLAAKRAIDGAISGVWYNESATNVFDALKPGADGKLRMQCSTASGLVMALLREVMPRPPKGAELVYVELPGHRAAGILTKDELLFSEATTKDGLVRVKRTAIDATTPLVVVKGESGDLVRFFNIGERADAVLIDTTSEHSRKTTGRKPGLDAALSAAAGARAPAGTSDDPFSFGEAHVPPGDIERRPAGMLSLAGYYGPREGDLAGRSRAQPGLSDEVKEKYVELFKALKGQELETVKSYLSHTEALSKFYDEHVPIMNDGRMSFAEKARRVDEIRKRARAYIDEHGVLELFRSSREILDAHGLTWRGNIHPIGIHDILANNAAYARSKAQ